MSGIEVITAAPRFVTPDEHKELVASTPASFSEIPAILYHEEKNVSIVFEPAFTGLTDADLASGTLYILSSVLAFISTTGRGFQVTYPTITLHAISRADLGPSIYCQLDETENDDKEDDGEDTEMRELTIKAQSEASLEPMFEAMSRGAALNPDESDEDGNDFDEAFVSDDDDDGRLTFDITQADGDAELTAAGRAARDYLESIIDDPQGFLRTADSHESKTETKGDADVQPKVNGSS